MIWTDSFGEGTTLNKQKRADLLLVMVTFFWGASYYLTNLCLTDLQPMNLNAFRFLSAFAVLGVVFRKRLRRISRSAFYKYKDAVQPFQDMKAGHIITFYALLRDNPGVLSSCLSIFAGSGANVLTINQTIPTNGCAGVTISAETSEMHEGLEEMIAQVSGADGVLKFEILAG